MPHFSQWVVGRSHGRGGGHNVKVLVHVHVYLVVIKSHCWLPHSFTDTLVYLLFDYWPSLYQYSSTYYLPSIPCNIVPLHVDDRLLLTFYGLIYIGDLFHIIQQQQQQRYCQP